MHRIILHVRNPKKYLLTVFLKQNKTGKKNIFAVKKLHVFSVCLCMGRVVLSSMTCLAVPYSSVLPHKRHDFRENVTEQKMCVLIICTTFS